ncbi:hypothetical protein E3T43_15530 [Cryobacterium sp. Hh7]|uniref:hypothetical protein n=1 Tax=Cryobacterium sp. Hh7 TaxID=1259159 RepID=UPI00106C5372|nr:hypothetical protein [Cryobacterium sp. Hh7]TFD52040.1 hypothetical protein E3T43_15530 [Cryobacterium sp. Hh7]
MRKTVISRRRLTLSGIGLCALVALSGCAAALPLPSGPQAEAKIMPLEESFAIADQLAEDLAFPPMDLETMQWLDRLQGELAEDANFGSPAISNDRSTVTIIWYGTPSARLEELVAQAPETLTVVIQPAVFIPAELTELTQRAVTTPGLVLGAEVAMGSPAPDASGITIGIVELPVGHTLEQLGIAFAQALQRPDVTVTVEVSGTIVPFNS